MLTLIPAYGRDYETRAAARSAFTSNQDFIIADMSSPFDGKPVNREDLIREGSHAQVKIRFKKLTETMVLDIPAGA